MNWSVGKNGTVCQKPAPAIGLSTPAIGCVLYMPGLPGGGSKIYDRSPYGNIGTIVGATWTRLPSGLWCLDFDGTDDYITVTDTASIRNLAEYTIEFWAYIEVLQNGDRFLDKGGQQKFYMITGEHLTAQRVYDETIANATSTTTFSLSTWQHLVCTLTESDKTIRLYINGDEVSYSAQTPGVGALVDDTGDMLIYDRAAHDRKVDGKIALFRLHNRALSALEIQNHYQQEKHLFGVW